MSKHDGLPDGARCICELPAGSRITEFRGHLLVVRPELPPAWLTLDGLVELEPLDVTAWRAGEHRSV